MIPITLIVAHYRLFINKRMSEQSSSCDIQMFYVFDHTADNPCGFDRVYIFYLFILKTIYTRLIGQWVFVHNTNTGTGMR